MTANPGRTYERNVSAMLAELKALCGAPVQIMEVCGTHTVAIAKSGLRQLLPPALRLLSGPGCPVCVTDAGDIDRVLALAGMEGVTLLTFGDMLHVPGSSGSLERARAFKNNVRVVYSPADALEAARREPKKEFVFLGVGFETTAPAVAAVLLRAKKEGLSNFSVAPLFKLVPPALRAILARPERKIDGFLLPGHVSTIIGADAYRFLAEEFGVPGVISGFDPEDILEALVMLLDLIRSGRAAVKNQYARSVTPAGNREALSLLAEVFEVAAASWRAIGRMEGSGLALRPAYRAFDAFLKFAVPGISASEPAGCRCGQILLGLCGPADCLLFGGRCTPQDPVGPCMVSSEGACAAAYAYGAERS